MDSCTCGGELICRLLKIFSYDCSGLDASINYSVLIGTLFTLKALLFKLSCPAFSCYYQNLPLPESTLYRDIYHLESSCVVVVTTWIYYAIQDGELSLTTVAHVLAAGLGATIGLLYMCFLSICIQFNLIHEHKLGHKKKIRNCKSEITSPFSSSD